jgi:hydrogenase maturation protein HypF
MAEFGMCERCSAEYHDSADRYFHAQPIACPECGPFVALRDNHIRFTGSVSNISSIECRTSAILKARRLLREGYILGVKSLGGFYLLCDASNSLSVEELRDRKKCVERPFALIASDVEYVRSICHLNNEEEALLTGREKPIVLLEKKSQNNVAQKVSRWVAPNLDRLGVMLPYTPLQHLLLNQTDRILDAEPVPPLLVVTSGNFTEEPISIDDEDALQRLAPLADAFLVHNRDIYVCCDDSVVRVDRSSATAAERQTQTVYLRRGRGYAPYAVKLPIHVMPTLAVGGELANTFCLAQDQQAFISPPIGDMENAETVRFQAKGVRHLSKILDIEPELIAHDLLADAFTTQAISFSTAGIPQMGIQHHHAHIVSCMVDNGLDDRRLIGLAFDRGGYGTDGRIWGGEILLASFANFERFGHLEYLPLLDRNSPGNSVRSIAAGYAHALGIDISDLPSLQDIDLHQLHTSWSTANPVLTSSMGYLFDSVASLIGVKNEAIHEAQAALELEALAKPFVSMVPSYPYKVDATNCILLKDLFNAILQDVRTNKSIEIIAARFHRTIADIAVDICKQAHQITGLSEIALSGDVWENQVLLNLVRKELQQTGFIVYVHQQIPTNDGGLAPGQVIIANSCTGTRDCAPATQHERPSNSRIR